MSKLIRNTSLYSIGNLLPQLVGFILLPLYTKYLPPDQYGIVNSMQVLSAFLMVFFTLAIERSIYRIYFDYKEPEDRKKYIGTISLLLFISSSSVLILLLAFHNYISLVFKSINFYPFYLFAIIATFLSSYSNVPKIYYQVNEKAGKFISISLTQFVINTSFIIFFVVFLKEGAEGLLKGQMIGNLILMPLYLIITYKISNFSLEKIIIIKTLKFSLPLIPSLISAWILSMADRIFIERYFTLKDVGIYALGYKISSIIIIAASAFNLAYNPIFYKLANSNEQKNVKEKLYNYNNVFILGIIFISFFLALFAKEVISNFLNVRYLEAYKIVPLFNIWYGYKSKRRINKSFHISRKKNQGIDVYCSLMCICKYFFKLFIYTTFGSFWCCIYSYYNKHNIIWCKLSVF